MDKKQQTINTYNQSADFFIDKFNSLSAMVDYIKLCMSHLDKPNPKILELGCGTGRDAKYISRFTSDYLGIDFSEKMIEAARKNTPEANFLVADLEDFEFPKNLDIIFAFASLLHSDKEHLKDILNKAAESLNQKGVFFISLKLDSYREEIMVEDIGTRTFYYYTPEELQELASVNLKKIVFKDKQKHGRSQWFSIILQKE